MAELLEKKFVLYLFSVFLIRGIFPLYVIYQILALLIVYRVI
jgi:hypothetical protein